MGKYMENESLDVMVRTIVDKEIADYKERLKKNMLQHLNSPYCAKTGVGNVMYEREILNVIDGTK